MEIVEQHFVFLPLRIRKKALERREETITVDRACRQETLAYEMVSCLSSCRISGQPNNTTSGYFFIHRYEMYVVNVCRYNFAGND